MDSPILLLVIISFTKASENIFSSEDKNRLRIEGDVMIGGLVAIRDAGGVNSLLCESDLSMFGMMRLEAMRYAVQKVNENPTLLLGLKLGIEVRDSCGTETKALDESLQFVINRGSEVCESVANSSKTFFGVVGDGMSLTTAAVASLLRLFQIPMVTYGATSTVLSDQSKYSHLLRTVPPDSFQSLAMIDFIEEKLNWKSIYGLYSTGSYGEYGFAGFLKAAENRTLRVVNQKKITPGASVADLQAIIKEFHKSEPSIKGILCYCEIPDAKNIVQAIKEENLTSHYRLIASDTWFQVKSDNTIVFSLHYDQTYVNDFYDNWYSSLSPENFTNEENPWFKSFWEQACKENVHGTNSNFTCNSFQNDSFRFCLNSTMNETCQRDDKIPYTMDAVYAFAQAIHSYIVKVHNSDVREFKSKPEINRAEFLSILKNVSFNGTSGLVKFPVVGRYDIRYRSKGEFELIGEWSDTSSNKLKMYKEDFRTLFGSSSCQMFCNKSAGEKLFYTTKQYCWECKKCEDNEYLPSSDKCEPCQRGCWPDSLSEKCVEQTPEQISLAWSIIIRLLGSIGFIVTFITIITFLKNNSTPLVRASGREMTYLLLVGILLLFFLPFFMLSFPTLFMCRASRFGLGLCLCICYSSLLIKTNRIARIFSGRQDVSFLTPRWQLVLVAILLLPQVCI